MGMSYLAAAARSHPLSLVRQTQEQALYEVRRKIYPRAVHGVFARWRVASSF